MGGNDHRFRDLFQILKGAHDLLTGGNIQIGCWLVQQQDTRIQRHPDGQTGPAHLPAREQTAVPVPQAGQTETLEQPVGAAGRIGNAPGLHRVGDVLFDRILDEHIFGVLVDHRDLAGKGLRPDVPQRPSMQADRAGRRLHQPHQQFHKGGFARPVGSDEGHLVPFVDRKAEPVEHLVRFPLDAAVGHRNVLEGGHRLPLRRDGRPRGGRRVCPGDKHFPAL